MLAKKHLLDFFDLVFTKGILIFAKGAKEIVVSQEKYL